MLKHYRELGGTAELMITKHSYFTCIYIDSVSDIMDIKYWFDQGHNTSAWEWQSGWQVLFMSHN